MYYTWLMCHKDKEDYAIDYISIAADGEIEYEFKKVAPVYDEASHKSFYRMTELHDYTSQNWWSWVYRWFLGLLATVALGFAVWNWEAFVRLYYQLTPHPAASMVKDAIRAGVEFDAQAFADIVRDLPGSRVGQDVRNTQAETLTKMARMSNEQLRRIADELRHQFEEQAKYQAAHGEHLDEVAEQLAKARTDAYAKAQEFWNSRRKT